MPDASEALRRRPPAAALLVLVFLASISGPLRLAEAALPTGFHQDQSSQPLTGLVGTSITDVVFSGRFLWVATERGDRKSVV